MGKERQERCVACGSIADYLDGVDADEGFYCAACADRYLSLCPLCKEYYDSAGSGEGMRNGVAVCAECGTW